MTSQEECMREAAECDRLAGLAATLFTRNMMKAAAFHWRKLAEVERAMSGTIRNGVSIPLLLWLQLASATYA
jgi:hypothetical protein